jgi:hydrogenase maturation protease
VGNPDRGDDGFGPAVAARLARLSLPEAERIVCARPLDLLDRWPGRRLAIVIDAALGEEPGRLRRLEPLCQGLPLPTSFSTHGFGLVEAIELGRSLGLLPARLVLYVAEARSFVHGAPLSPRVAAAVEEAAARIAEECRG